MYTYICFVTTPRDIWAVFQALCMRITLVDIEGTISDRAYLWILCMQNMCKAYLAMDIKYNMDIIF